MLDINKAFVKEEIVECFDISYDEIEAHEEAIADLVKLVFDDWDIEYDEEAIEDIQAMMLDNTAAQMQSYAERYDEVVKPASTATPEEHFRNIASEIKEQGDAGRQNIMFTAGAVRGEIDDPSEHAVGELIGKIHQRKYEQHTTN